MIDLTFDQKQVQEADRLLAPIPRGAAKAISRALNKTTATVNSRTVKDLTPQAKMAGLTRIRQKDMRRAIRFTRASVRRHESRLKIRGGKDFQELLSAPFIQRMPSGYVSQFVRVKGWERRRARGRGSGPKHGLPVFDVRPQTRGSNLPTRVLSMSAIISAIRKASMDGGSLLEKNLATQVELILQKGRS